MSLINDSRLWFNMPGCVAAYQPVRAPGPVDARYNQVGGGTNKLKAVDGTSPNWDARFGWTFNGSTQYLSVLFRSQVFSVLFRVNIPSFSADASILRGGGGSLQLRTTSAAKINILSAYVADLGTSSGTLSANINQIGAVTYDDAGKYEFYIGGKGSGSGTNLKTFTADTIYISDASTEKFAGSLHAIAIYYRALTPNEIWTASLQMKYCDVNPEWSAWGRRREWFIFDPAAPAGHTFNPTRHPPISKLGGGL